LPKSRLFVGVYDLHFPEVDWPAFRALLNFLDHNKVDGFIWGGDQFDNSSISHHNKKKIAIEAGEPLSEIERRFDHEVLTKIERRLPSGCIKVWIEGNHDDWENQYVAEHPQMKGKVERKHTLNLIERGWKFIPCGKRHKEGKLNFIHGEVLSGRGNQASQYHAKKAVETFCGNVVYGHMHSPQFYTKVLPHDETNKWMAFCSPILGAVNPSYLRNNPTSWLNGFMICEFRSDGHFNVYPIIITKGEFAWGGRVYKG
jgi:predicted phosphodiesterase